MPAELKGEKGFSSLSPLQRKLEREKRLATVLDMYSAGASYEDISKVTGTTRQTAYNDVRYALAVLAKQREGVTTRMIDTQLLRYNRLLQTWWPKALEGGDKATDKVLSVMREINKLLALGAYGDGGVANGPQRVELKWGDVVQVNVNIDNSGIQPPQQGQADVVEGILSPQELLGEPTLIEFTEYEFDDASEGDQASSPPPEPV